MHLRFLPFLLLLLTWFSACKVQELPTQVNYTYQNNSNQRLTINVFSSQQDYSNNTHATVSRTVAPGASASIPFNIQDKVWVDWFSDDYSVSNWYTKRTGKFINPLSPEAETDIAAEDNTISMSPLDNLYDTSRSILINGNDSGTLWEMDVNSSSSTSMNGKHLFLLKKDFSCQYTFIDLSGQSHVSTAYYTVQKYYSSSLSTRTAGFYLNIYTDMTASNRIAGATFNTGQGTVNRDILDGYITPPSGIATYFPLVRK